MAKRRKRGTLEKPALAEACTETTDEQPLKKQKKEKPAVVKDPGFRLVIEHW